MISPTECKVSDRHTVIVKCRRCHADVDTGATPAEMNRYFHSGEYIQTCMPHLPAEMREMFISGTCGVCWDVMFADDDEGPMGAGS